MFKILDDFKQKTMDFEDGKLSNHLNSEHQQLGSVIIMLTNPMIMLNCVNHFSDIIDMNVITRVGDKAKEGFI